ncbi:uncharacterized protein LOC123016463 isoform X2 [Tribolium madens]|uniref:uncharacterized protein LOC123016463 isoform X2 n=1 Tax=Tribolium madens TaxID=41895 RepID=UPI001CF7355C|nr:uncharacterized protein LOC123016463 isoform X2 [Tribolium madens]
MYSAILSREDECDDVKKKLEKLYRGITPTDTEKKRFKNYKEFKSILMKIDKFNATERNKLYSYSYTLELISYFKKYGFMKVEENFTLPLQHTPGTSTTIRGDQRELHQEPQKTEPKQSQRKPRNPVVVDFQNERRKSLETKHRGNLPQPHSYNHRKSSQELSKNCYDGEENYKHFVSNPSSSFNYEQLSDNCSNREEPMEVDDYETTTNAQETSSLLHQQQIENVGQQFKNENKEMTCFPKYVERSVCQSNIKKDQDMFWQQNPYLQTSHSSINQKQDFEQLVETDNQLEDLGLRTGLGKVRKYENRKKKASVDQNKKTFSIENGILEISSGFERKISTTDQIIDVGQNLNKKENYSQSFHNQGTSKNVFPNHGQTFPTLYKQETKPNELNQKPEVRGRGRYYQKSVPYRENRSSSLRKQNNNTKEFTKLQETGSAEQSSSYNYRQDLKHSSYPAVNNNNYGQKNYFHRHRGDIEDNRQQKTTTAVEEYQEKPVEKAEEAKEEPPLEILDVHQFFCDDFDINSLSQIESNTEKIGTIANWAQTFHTKVSHFRESKDSIEYFVLDEKLMRLIEAIDKIKCHQEPEVMKRKIQVIEFINHLHTILDSRATE